jgi:hypothetical protein
LAGEAPAAAGLAEERWRSLAESLLQCSLHASLVVTDASVSGVRIFMLLPLGGALTNRRWSCRVSAVWVALASLWEAPTQVCVKVKLSMCLTN